MEVVNEDIPEYEDENEKIETTQTGIQFSKLLESKVQSKYASIHTSSFQDMMLKPELKRAIQSAGFEHPSEVQYQCIPEALSGLDVICQAKSGMGKTAVFVLTTLQLLDLETEDVSALIMCHTRELAFQISKEYERFSMYMPLVKVSVFFGGLPIQKDILALESIRPQIVVGTPGRILALMRLKKLNLKNLKFFILDECDRMLNQLDMRKDVQEIFRSTALDKQVMMFSATLSNNIRSLCKKFMKNPLEVYIDDEQKLSLNRLLQHYIRVSEMNKEVKLLQLLEVFDYNQVIIFVKSVQRCTALADLLDEKEFPASAIYRGMSQEKRLKCYQEFKDFETRILVATDLFGRGIDIEKVNIVFNFDMPDDSDTYLHRVGRTGRFGTKGLAITFISDEMDAKVITEVQNRFNVTITELPDEIEVASYCEEKL